MNTPITEDQADIMERCKMNLTPALKEEYIQWARDNYHTKVGISGTIKALWHPVVRAEMHRLKLRQMAGVKAHVKYIEAARTAHRKAEAMGASAHTSFQHLHRQRRGVAA